MAGGDNVTEIVGTVVSMPNGGVTNVAVLPAASVALPVMVLPPPSSLTVCGGGHAVTPEPVSAHEKVAVTGPFTKPAPFGTGDKNIANF